MTEPAMTEPAMTTASIGVLCLDTSFTKVPGHIRNRATFGFPVVCQVVPGATAQRIVTQADPALLQPFIEAARALQAQGVAAITGACGFLALFQRELADAVTVPLYASSLLQLPMVHRMIGSGRRVGLLVARERSLTRRHLAAVGAQDVPVCVAGMADQPEFREVILEARRDELDSGRLEREAVGQASGLVADHPDTGAIVLECTDLAPYAHAIQRCTGLPVFDIVTLTELVHHSLTRHPYPVPAAAVQ
jgi:Asp/Glu/hydantoin racemase